MATPSYIPINDIDKSDKDDTSISYPSTTVINTNDQNKRIYEQPLTNRPEEKRPVDNTFIGVITTTEYSTTRLASNDIFIRPSTVYVQYSDPTKASSSPTTKIAQNIVSTTTINAPFYYDFDETLDSLNEISDDKKGSVDYSFNDITFSPTHDNNFSDNFIVS